MGAAQKYVRTQQEFEKTLVDLNQLVRHGKHASPEIKQRILGYAEMLNDHASPEEFKQFIMSKLFEIKADQAVFNSLKLTPAEDERVKKIIMSQIS